MVGSGGRRTIAAIGVVALCIVAASLAAPFAVADDHTDPPDKSDSVQIDTHIHLWKPAILTTRAETDDAVATVDNAAWSIRDQNNRDPPLNRDPLAVYGVDSEVEIKFDEDNAYMGGVFDDTEVEVIRAYVQETGDGSVPSSTTDAVDLLKLEYANDNATFESLGTKTISNGELKFTDTPQTSGQYVYFLAVEDDTGFNVTDGDLSVEEPVTIVGAEQVAVRKGSGSVDAPNSVVRGSNASFEVNASGLQGDPITQGIVVYDEESYVQQEFTVEITSNLDSNFDFEEDTRLETSVEEVNGVATLEDDIKRFGLTLNDDRVSRSAGIEALMDFISESAGQEVPDNVETTNSNRLDASITVIDRSDKSATINVETLENWSTGQYTWIYVATGENSQELYVDTAPIEVKEATKGKDDPDDDPAGGGGGSPGGGGGGGLGTPIPSETPTPTATDTPEPTETTPTETTTETPTETETMTETETPTEPPLLDGDPADPPSDDGGLPMPVIIIGIAVVAAIIGAALLFLRP